MKQFKWETIEFRDGLDFKAYWKLSNWLTKNNCGSFKVLFATDDRIIIAVKSTTVTKVPKKDIKEKDDYMVFIDFFKELTGRDFGYFDKKAREQFTYLREHGNTREKFGKVILNAYADKYHIENKFKYLTPRFITRTDIFERYLAMADPKGYKSTSNSKSLEEMIAESQATYTE